MGSSSRLLELKLMNCKGLQAFNFFQKLSVHALVSLITDDDPGEKKKQQRTPTDTEGDKNPEWNHEMRFDLDTASPDDHLFLHVDLRCELAVFGDKSLGEVRVLLKDLIGGSSNKEDEEGFSSNGVARFVSYEVRTSDNKPNGVLSFSFKVLNQHPRASANTTAAASAGMNDNCGHIDGYTIVNPVNNNLHHQNNQDSVTYFPSASYMDSQGENLHIPQGQYDQGGSAYYSNAESMPHRIQYPALETPSYPPTPAGEGYINYPRFDHDPFQYPSAYPPPPPQPTIHVPPELSRPPFPPPPLPYPPPPPPPHHHLHHYMSHGAVYHPPPPPPWDVYGHSHSMPSDIYYNGDGTRRY